LASTLLMLAWLGAAWRSPVCTCITLWGGHNALNFGHVRAA
jgi:hypothetical protein